MCCAVLIVPFSPCCRAITGGTGRYTGVSGYVTRTDSDLVADYTPDTNPPFYKFVITNWNGNGYGY